MKIYADNSFGFIQIKAKQSVFDADEAVVCVKLQGEYTEEMEFNGNEAAQLAIALLKAALKAD